MAVVVASCKHPADETGGKVDEPDADVIVIGAGTAGLLAAREAEQAGAAVLVVEMAELAGGSAEFCGSFIAAGTTYQAAQGIDDSPETLLEQWDGFTGGDVTDSRVQAFVQESAETLEWLVESAGLAVRSIATDPDCGLQARKHWIDGAELALWEVEEVGQVRTLTRADRLVFEDGVLAGVEVTDMESGETATLLAPAVVVATGGFARDLDAFLDDRSLLHGADVVAEATLVSAGHGLPLVQEAGLSWQNEGHYGTYVHSVVDPREGMEGEALMLRRLERSVVVDLSGRRVANEELTKTLDMVNIMEQVRDQALYALYPTEEWDEQEAQVPGYNQELSDGSITVGGDALLEAGVAVLYDSPEAMAEATGVDAPTLRATFDAYQEMVEAGADTQFGKDAEYLYAFEDDALVAVQLLPGAAKAFVGLEVDDEARVLGGDDELVDGLFAAGEAVGMLGTPAVGDGFAGSCTAVAWLARLAGAGAAAYALDAEASAR